MSKYRGKQRNTFLQSELHCGKSTTQTFEFKGGCTSSLLCRHKFSTYLRKYQGGWLPDHMAGICWVFQEAAEVSSKWRRRRALLPITREFPRSTTSPAPGGVSVLILVLLIGVSCLRLTTSRIRFSILSLAAPLLPNCFKWKPLLVFVC